MSQLEDLLQECTVKLTLPGRIGWGTGFFVAPGLILTCAHVVREAKGEPVQVRWQNQENWGQAVVERSLPDPYDLALLRVTLPADANPPCVYLDKVIESRDELYLFGYPDEGDRQGEPRTFNCDGKTGSEIPSILFNLGQVRPGMSGSPLLNQRTGKVCGIVKFTRHSSSDLGGGAIPTSVILDQFPELVEQQRSFHQRDQRWNALAAKLSREASQGKQTVKSILMLSANPKNPKTERRKKEIEKITNALGRATLKRREKHKNPTLFDEPHDKLDIKADKLDEELSAIKPWIIQISGSANGIEGLTRESDSGRATSKTPEKSIADLFEFHAKSVQCIILNGCYSDVQAREIVQYIDFVIGINQDLEESKVLKFLDDFYFYIGSERTIIDSYQRSCHHLNGTGIQNKLMPILLDKSNEKQHRDWEEELRNCEQKIEKDPDNPKLWLKKARLLKKLEYFKKANEAYEKASLLAPNDPKIKTEQAEALEQSGNQKKAINAFGKAVELEPGDYKVWWKKGQAHVKAKEYKEAVESYDRAIELAVKREPSSPDRYMICREYAYLLEKLGKYQQSIAMYKKSLGFESKYRASSYLKRQVYKKMYSDRG
ncbi:MAG: tetratricopeptide repeat-containing serine protease family protein [Coleofasciculaceae cyanobacterium]